MDPWKVGAVITPSVSLVNQFHAWDKTKALDKRMRSFNRAKQWISKLLSRPLSVPNTHKMRHEDLQNAVDHMVSAHARGLSHVDYLRSCLAPDLVQIDPAQHTQHTTQDSAQNPIICGE